MSRRPPPDAEAVALALDAMAEAARCASLATALAAEALEALRPFAQPGLQEALGGNVQGDDSPVFGRQRDTLTLGDFRLAKAAHDKLLETSALLRPPRRGGGIDTDQFGVL